MGAGAEAAAGAERVWGEGIGVCPQGELLAALCTFLLMISIGVVCIDSQLAACTCMMYIMCLCSFELLAGVPVATGLSVLMVLAAGHVCVALQCSDKSHCVRHHSCVS